MSTDGITISITEDVTSVTVTEDVTTLNITPSVTTIEAKGISIANASAATAVTYQGLSNTNLAIGGNVAAALDHINTNGFSKTLGGTVAGATDFTAAVTATTIDASGLISGTDITLTDGNPAITIIDSDGTNQQTEIKQVSGSLITTVQNGTGHGAIDFRSTNGTDNLLRFRVAVDGDANFYKNDGSTVGVKWDAPNGRLGIGTTTPATALDVNGTVTGTGLDINGNADVSGNIVIGGNLEVQGTTTTVDSTTVNIADKNIELGYNAITDLQNDGAGITISRPESTDATITWDETNDRFAMTNGLYLQGDLQLNGFPESPYEVKGDIDGGIRFDAQADEDLAKGDVIYISGASGDNTLIRKARADSASTMPAFGLCLKAATSGNQVQVVTFGNLYGSGAPAFRLDTSAYSPGTTLYVSATEAGVWTSQKPAGESNFIQNIGKVVRSSTTNGVIKVGGAGRSNATGNLNDGNIFIGNASNQAATASFDTTFASSFATRFVDEDDMSSNSATKAPSQQSVKAYVDSQILTKDNTDEITEGSTNLYFTNDRADARVTALAVLDSEVDADIKTLSLPANTTISTYGKSLVDDADASAARTTLGLGTAATTASTDYATAAQGATADAALAASAVSTFGGTLIDDADAATARTTLGLGTAATTASTDYATAAQGTTADSALQPGDVVDNLTSTSTTTPLSAAQGKALQDNKQANLTFGIADDNAVEIDGTATSGDVAVFTANGITSSSTPTVDSLILEAGDDDWSFVTENNDLIIKRGTTRVAKLDENGNLIVKGNVTAYGSV